MNTIVHEETLTGRPHDTSVQKATSGNEMWMQFNVMSRTQQTNKECFVVYCPLDAARLAGLGHGSLYYRCYNTDIHGWAKFNSQEYRATAPS